MKGIARLKCRRCEYAFWHRDYEGFNLNVICPDCSGLTRVMEKVDTGYCLFTWDWEEL